MGPRQAWVTAAKSRCQVRGVAAERPRMNRMNTAINPESIVELQRRLDEFRKHPAAAEEAARVGVASYARTGREHLVYSVVRPLTLVSHHGRKARRPALVERIAPNGATLREWVIECEFSRVGKAPMQWKAGAPPDGMGLLCSWRETER